MQQQQQQCCSCNRIWVTVADTVTDDVFRFENNIAAREKRVF